MIFNQKIRLRGTERTDLTQFVNWLNDPDIIEGLQLYAPLSLAEEELWFENMQKRPIDEHPYVIEFRQGDTWIAIGNCGFHNIDYRCRSAEVGIFIDEKQYWNQGLGTEAMKLLLGHGFETLNLNRIMLEVYSTNPRAIKSYQNAGFTIEGRKRQGMYKGGKYIDILIMCILRDEWIKRSA